MPMLHPIFSTAIQRPDLVIDHLSAYSALIGQEAKTAGSQYLKRAVASVVAVMCGAVFLSLAGIAVMLGILQNQFHWVLVAVPGAALLLTVVAIFEAKKPSPADTFAELKVQLARDTSALRMAA